MKVTSKGKKNGMWPYHGKNFNDISRNDALLLAKIVFPQINWENSQFEKVKNGLAVQSMYGIEILFTHKKNSFNIEYKPDIFKRVPIGFGPFFSRAMEKAIHVLGYYTPTGFKQ
jgi:hypothetical protein